MKGREGVNHLPAWIEKLEDEDLAFVKRFVLASGSLKEVAAQYGVSYPTVRLRLDRLIQKIMLAESREEDAYVSLVKRLAVELLILRQLLRRLSFSMRSMAMKKPVYRSF